MTASQQSSSQTTWQQFLGPYQSSVPLLSREFIARWGDEPWRPSDDDRKAAARLHTQLESRIATQRLDYRDGVEKAALDSVFALFQKTRDIVDQFPACRHVDALAWEVLNNKVRPFTAKWHRRNERGDLRALDSTDEFRADLGDLQPVLRCLDALLIHIRDGVPYPGGIEGAARGKSEISDEMSQPAPFGIPRDTGGVAPESAVRINTAEAASVSARRKFYAQTHGVDVDAVHATGLALSGGGIRSATFSLGVLIALARRGVLPHVDFLSTVSGGGYLGSFISTFLESPPRAARGADVSSANDAIGLGPTQLPFSRESGEPAALRHIRHQSKYLASGSMLQRSQMVAAQFFGMTLNAAAVLLLVAIVVQVERFVRGVEVLDGLRAPVTAAATVALVAAAITALAILRFSRRHKSRADRLVAVTVGALAAILLWYQLPAMRAWGWSLPEIGWTWLSLDQDLLLALAGAIPLVTSMFAVLFGPKFQRAKLVLVALSAIAAPLFLIGVYLLMHRWAETATVTLPFWGTATGSQILWGAIAVGLLLYTLLFDINTTSPHRHYRDRLAGAYLIQPAAVPTADKPFDTRVALRLSDLGRHHRAPYHLINCALNVPSSRDPRMQGRLTDFFLFSPHYSGSPLVGYTPTKRFEDQDLHLDLATAMAISGAAAAPQMGLGTMRRWSFWLALLNVRLGYWVRKPGARGLLNAPGLAMLLREMLGNMHENLPWLNVSDGGHIENLGVYELLRRRCKYIIAIDGEQDGKMTFQALTTVQRMAAIDFGVTIDLDLDDLRLSADGLSRSHFRFCRIHYPAATDAPAATGYLLYVKLSLTGNEGEFIRRYRLEEPVFPHHSTADQLFSESQFEAYRALGEHVGDKLFLRSLVDDLGDRDDVKVEEWFRRLGVGLLEPQRPS